MSAYIKTEFGSELVYKKEFLKNRIKSYGDANADFQDKEIRKTGSDCSCLAEITTDSALKKDENYYLQAVLKEFKYIEREVIRHITEDVEIFSSDEE